MNRARNNLAHAVPQSWHIAFIQTGSFDRIVEVHHNGRWPQDPARLAVEFERTHDAHRQNGRAELRRHPDATRYTLLAAFCQQRTGEVTDSLVDLLLLVIRRIGAKAEKHVKKQYLDELAM